MTRSAMRELREWIANNKVVAISTEEHEGKVYLNLIQIKEGKLTDEQYVIQINSVENSDKTFNDKLN